MNGIGSNNCIQLLHAHRTRGIKIRSIVSLIEFNVDLNLPLQMSQLNKGSSSISTE